MKFIIGKRIIKCKKSAMLCVNYIYIRLGGNGTFTKTILNDQKKKKRKKKNKKKEKPQKTSIRISTQVQNLKTHRTPNLIPFPFLTKLSNLTLILLIKKLWPERRSLPRSPSWSVADLSIFGPLPISYHHLCLQMVLCPPSFWGVSVKAHTQNDLNRFSLEIG